MAVAPYDPLAQAHQTSLRLYAPDVKARINPAAPGLIPSNPTGTATGQDGLGPREDGWVRSERYQQMAGNGFMSGGSGWQAFAGGGRRPAMNGGGSAQIDGGAPTPRPQAPRLDIPANAGGFARQGAAFDYAASFQEHARSWTLGLGSRR